MADTVEEVYVWSGTDWVPVVRDDCELPISSSDDTVTLDGAGNTFTVSTGGQTRAVFRDGLGRRPATAAELNNSNIFTIEGTTSGTAAEPGYTGMSFVGRYTQGISGCIGVEQYYNQGTDVANRKGAFVFGLRNPAGDTSPPVDVLTIDTTAATFNGQVQTDKITSQSGATNNAAIELGADLIVRAGGKNQFRSTGDNCIRTLQVGSESQPALAFSDTTTGFFFAPDDANDYYTATSGLAFTIDNANQGVPPREVLRFQRNGQLITSNAYTPTQPNSLATKQTVDDKIWVGSAAEYDDIATKNPTTLYCLTD